MRRGAKSGPRRRRREWIGAAGVGGGGRERRLPPVLKQALGFACGLWIAPPPILSPPPHLDPLPNAKHPKWALLPPPRALCHSETVMASVQLASSAPWMGVWHWVFWGGEWGEGCCANLARPVLIVKVCASSLRLLLVAQGIKRPPSGGSPADPPQDILKKQKNPFMPKTGSQVLPTPYPITLAEKHPSQPPQTRRLLGTPREEMRTFCLQILPRHFPSPPGIPSCCFCRLLGHCGCCCHLNIPRPSPPPHSCLCYLDATIVVRGAEKALEASWRNWPGRVMFWG